MEGEKEVLSRGISTCQVPEKGIFLICFKSVRDDAMVFRLSNQVNEVVIYYDGRVQRGTDVYEKNQESGFGHINFEMFIRLPSGDVEQQAKFRGRDWNLSAIIIEMIFKTMSLDTISSGVTIDIEDWITITLQG